MKTNGLRRNYDKLTANERYKAVMAAYGRGDRTECKALVAACPERTYQMNDAAYTSNLENTTRIGNMIIFQLMSHIYTANMLDMTGTRVDDQATDQVHAMTLRLYNVAAEIWQGFTGFCDDIGVEPDDFLKMSDYGLFSRVSEAKGHLLVCVTAFDAVKQQAATGDADADEAEGWRRELLAFWREA